MRLPIVLANINRALASPLNIMGDHSDMYLGRDAGWISITGFNPQEAYDLGLCAFKIGENKNVRLPVQVNQDGFIVSHTSERVETLSDDEAYEFIGDYIAVNPMLDFNHPATYGAQTEEDWHFEHKAQQTEALMNKTLPVIEEVFKEFKEKTGREYKFVETYNTEDAELVIAVTGSAYETTILAVDELRKAGVKAGVIGIRVFRPFPVRELEKLIPCSTKAIAIMDRSAPMGAMGALYSEITSVLYNTPKNPVALNYIYGLGGRDMKIEDINVIYNELDECVKAGEVKYPLQQFIGLRGPKLSFF
jgi:pyruvate ferredoxin oxidoreductase alpha subunit